MIRTVLTLSALLLSACVSPRPAVTAGDAQPGRPGLRIECREAADRTLVRQDRGQLLREDERNARLGSESGGASGLRAQFDGLGRQYRRDQLAADCERRSGYSAPTPTTR